MRQVTEEAEATRLSFADTPQGPRQIVAPAFMREMPYLDFSGARGSGRRRAVVDARRLQPQG